MEPVKGWFEAWRSHPIALPPGQLLPELTLTVPLGGERLLARFDLLVLSADSAGGAMIVDWKTERRPRERHELAEDIQSDLYPFVLAEGAPALNPRRSGEPISPDQIEIVYWQANDPTNPVHIRYSTSAHVENRARFEALVATARDLKPDIEPPPTDRVDLCGRCRFATYCGMVPAEGGMMEDDTDTDDLAMRPPLVPER